MTVNFVEIACETAKPKRRRAFRKMMVNNSFRVDVTGGHAGHDLAGIDLSSTF
ncbi:MAG: hypothetical protein PHT96_11770 [Syntrophorhabdaceae bacterium]|nr:hypothetical protein [Syntrophorhabdaceae bacterium]